MEPKGICPVVTSEDCLYLNVWTPSNSTGPLPVMVFFPGGNYRQDAASTDLYWGEYFPQAGQIVLVTVNYRLGTLGFLVTEWAQGNLGLRDQILALEWVQANIGYFGGDPSKVTIFGQSAGAESVIMHMYSPFTMGKNLFQRTICMSGSLGIAFKDQKESLSVGNEFSKHIGCEPSDQACFLNKTSEEVLTAQLATKLLPWPNTFMKAYEWSPTIGSAEVPYQALDGLQTGNFTPVPIILGTLLEEGVQFVDLLFTSPMDEIEYEAAIAFVFGTAAIDILRAYPCHGNETSDCRPVMAEIATHKVFSCPTRNAARTIAQKAPQLANSVYIYFYDHPLSFPGWGANFSYCNGHVCHGSELPVLYNSATSYGFTFQPDELTLALQMEQFWGQFAHGATGPITIPSSNVPWPVYNATGSYTMQLNTPTLQIQQNRLNTLCDMWDKIGYY
eukprot:Phypoly_transcript_08181.p1 GENE.Phypoly_transcript_08181~~Phypoly_transcript_08181.p1  ORF type:complete len:509 (+),score=48.86 Phypoly_transcript_08181:192-1529(+)